MADVAGDTDDAGTEPVRPRAGHRRRCHASSQLCRTTSVPRWRIEDDDSVGVQ